MIFKVTVCRDVRKHIPLKKKTDLQLQRGALKLSLEWVCSSHWNYCFYFSFHLQSNTDESRRENDKRESQKTLEIKWPFSSQVTARNCEHTNQLKMWLIYAFINVSGFISMSQFFLSDNAIYLKTVLQKKISRLK